MSRRTTRGSALAWPCAWPLAIAATSLRPSARATAQVFRAEANLVYVDVYPRREDRLVEGLTAKDFQVFEDGKPQSVQTFEFITFASSPVDSDRRDPTSVADSERQAADPRNRLFVVYLDRFHTTRAGSRDSRQPLVDFLNRTIGASDLFAVMTPETPIGGLTFARRTDTIESELAKHWDWGERDQLLIPRTPAEEHLVSCAIGRVPGDADEGRRDSPALPRAPDAQQPGRADPAASRHSRRTHESDPGLGRLGARAGTRGSGQVSGLRAAANPDRSASAAVDRSCAAIRRPAILTQAGCRAERRRRSRR